MTLDDGTQVEVLLDENLRVVGGADDATTTRRRLTTQCSDDWLAGDPRH